MRTSIALYSSCELGEAPFWDDRRGCLFFLDIQAGVLFEFYNSSCYLTHKVESSTSVVIPTERDGLLLAHGNAVSLFSIDSGETRPLHLAVREPVNNRFNDGKCDSRGRLWVSSMDRRETNNSGSLWCFENNKFRPDAYFGDFVIGNGIGWNNDSTTMYFTDSKKRKILKFEYEVATGEIGNCQPFAHIPASLGLPDGLVVDANDHVWSAIWGGGCLLRFCPDGEIDRVIPVPARYPTSLAFGGDDYCDLYITTARPRSSKFNREYDGALLVLKSSFNGHRPNYFRYS